MALPLDGIKIVDFTIQMQGPQATQMLADMGAEVFKIERPERLGGPSGRVDERYGLTGNYKIKPEENRWYASAFQAHNRNKKSLTVDLKNPRGIEIIKRLIAKSDVVYENFRPNVMNRLGIGYEDCARLNPGIIFASASGYGPDGPYVNRPGQDLLAQGVSGFASMNATADGRPTTVALSTGDLLGAMYGAYGVMGALFHRQKTGEGQRMTVCLVDSLIAALSEVATHVLNTDVEENRGSVQHACPYIPTPYGIYKTKDGYIALSGSQTVPKLSEVLGLADLTQDPRFDDFWKRVNNRKEMDQVLEDALLARTTAEWIEIMGKADLWCGEVNTLQQAFRDPQIVHNKMVSTVDSPVGPMHLVSPPYKLSKTPATVRTPAPKLGQHTDEILKFAGYSDEEIAAFRKEGVV